MTILISQGFSSYQLVTPQWSIKWSSLLAEIAKDNELDYYIEFPYIVFNNEEDYLLMQLCVGD